MKKAELENQFRNRYLTVLRTRGLINEAIAHYESGRYQRALYGYSIMSSSAADNALHVRNGLYLANLKLGRNDAAMKAFGNIIDLAWPTTSLR